MCSNRESGENGETAVAVVSHSACSLSGRISGINNITCELIQ